MTAAFAQWLVGRGRPVACIDTLNPTLLQYRPLQATHLIQARGRQLPQPSPLQLLRRQDVLDLELPPPDLSPYGATGNAAEEGDGLVDH